MASEIRRSTAVSIGNWMWSLLLAAIPVINVLFFIITACASKNKSKRNWAIANLLWILIVAAIFCLCYFVFGKQIEQALLTYLANLSTTLK